MKFACDRIKLAISSSSPIEQVSGRQMPVLSLRPRELAMLPLRNKIIRKPHQNLLRIAYKSLKLKLKLDARALSLVPSYDTMQCLPFMVSTSGSAVSCLKLTHPSKSPKLITFPARTPCCSFPQVSKTSNEQKTEFERIQTEPSSPQAYILKPNSRDFPMLH